MAKGKFKCSKCDRSFSMAAHLGRHISTMHATKSGKKAAKKKTRKRKAKRKVGRPKGTKKKVRRAKVARRAARRPIARGTAGLIRQMQVYHRKLSAEQADLEAQITAMDRAIVALGGAAKTRPGGQGRRAGTRRGIRPGSLKDHIAKVLRRGKKAMTPGEVTKRLVQAGYKTGSKSLSNQVSNALGQMPGVKKLRRGLFQA